MRLDLRPFSSAFQETCMALLSWWVRELREVADELLVRVLPRLVTRVVVGLRADEVSVWLIRGQQRELVLSSSIGSPGSWPTSLELSGSAARGARAVVALDPEYVLTRGLTLPESVERDLDEVLTFQLERESPIPPDRACIDKRITSRLRGERQIRVEVLIAHRHRVEQARQLVSGWGFHVTRVGVGTDPDKVSGNFLRARMRLSRLKLTSIERRLAVSAAALAALWLGVVGAHWMYERTRVDRELERLRGPAVAATRLAQDLRARAAPAEELVRLMHEPDALEALSVLSTEIPKDSWAYELEISAQWPQVPRIKLSGFTPVATMLIGRLESSGRFQHVRLVSAMSAGLGSGQDRLQLTAQLASEGGGSTADSSHPERKSMLSSPSGALR